MWFCTTEAVATSLQIGTGGVTLLHRRQKCILENVMLAVAGLLAAQSLNAWKPSDGALAMFHPIECAIGGL